MSDQETEFWNGKPPKGEQEPSVAIAGKSRRVLEEGYINVPDDPSAPIQLIASYSAAADTYYFPRRYRCPQTEEAVEDRLLSPVGTIYAWTYVFFPAMGRVKYADTGGYGVAQVDFPEGPRIQGVIYGQFGDWEIGMSVKVVLHPVAVADDGAELCGYAFAPIATDEGQ